MHGTVLLYVLPIEESYLFFPLFRPSNLSVFIQSVQIYHYICQHILDNILLDEIPDMLSKYQLIYKP